MIKLLLTTTTLGTLFLLPAFGMDLPPDQVASLPRSAAKASPTKKRTNFKRTLSGLFSLEPSAEKKYSSENQAAKYRKKAAYHEIETFVSLGNAAFFDAATAHQKYSHLMPKSKKGSVERIGETNSEADRAFQEKKDYLKDAEKHYAKAIALGSEKTQFHLAIVLTQLSAIDPQYGGPEVQERIRVLNKNASDAGSERAITVQSILGSPSPTIASIPEESGEPKQSKQPRKIRKKSFSTPNRNIKSIESKDSREDLLQSSTS